MSKECLLRAVCFSLSFVTAITVAQEASFPTLPGCVRQNSSRLAAPECGITVGSPIPVGQQLEHSITLTAPATETKACHATISLQYYQRNTIARVDGTIENESCAASGGSYVISASFRDAEGEVSTLGFPETWRREDSQPVTIGGDYGLGENVDLVRVRAADVRCICADSSEAE